MLAAASVFPDIPLYLVQNSVPISTRVRDFLENMEVVRLQGDKKGI